jgi:D-alanyl-D-alanine carboxypeptidase
VFAPGKGVLVKNYGTSDVPAGSPMRARDHVRIASISKTFTGIAVMRLIDRGRLKLGDRLSEFVKGIPNGDLITIRQLLGMTAGIYDFTRETAFNAAFSANPNIPWKPADVLKILRDPANPPNFAPGEMVSYSDSNYVLLGIIIRKITGRSPEAVITDKIVEPLGLDSTSFPRTSAMPRPFARGYYAGDDGMGVLRDYSFVNPAVPWTAGAMISNLGDLRDWALALGTGELLSKKAFRQQRQFRPINNPGLNVWYGLGMFKLQGWIGHNGAIYGYNTAMFFLPSERATILVTANKSTNFSEDALAMFIGIARHLYPEQFPPQPQP